MKAVIFAEGKGRISRPSVLPECMLPILRKPLLAYFIEYLRAHGVKQIMICTSYRNSFIEKYFYEGESMGVQIAYLYDSEYYDQEEQKPISTASALKRMQDFSSFFDDTFIVMYGNALMDLNLSKLVAVHRKRGANATVVLKNVPLTEVSDYAVTQRDPDGRITHFQEKPAQHEAVSTTVSADVYVLEPSVLSFLPAGRATEINEHLLPALAQANEAFYGVVVPFQSLSVDTLQNYWYASRQLMLGQLKGYRLPGQEIAPGIRTGLNVKVDLNSVEIRPPVYIGNGSYVGPGCKIYGPAVIGANCIIKDGAMLQECFIDDHTRISEIAALEQMIILGDKCIDPSGHVIDIKESDISWLISDARIEENDMSDSAEQLIELAKEVMEE